MLKNQTKKNAEIENLNKKMFFAKCNLSSSSATTGRLDVGLKTEKNFEFEFIIDLIIAKKNKNSPFYFKSKREQKEKSRFGVGRFLSGCYTNWTDIIRK